MKQQGERLLPGTGSTKPGGFRRRWVYAPAMITLIALVGGWVVIAGNPIERRAGGGGEDHPVPAEACRDVPAPKADAPDLSLTSANILTMDGHRRASELTIRSGRIGSLDAASTRVIDLEGATVLPGFIDSHGHWIGDKDLVSQDNQQAVETALSQGWTSVSELFVDEQDLNELCTLEEIGWLRVKVGAFLPINYEFEKSRPYEAYEPGHRFGPHLFLQGVKIFADRAQDGLGRQTDPPNPSVQGTLFWEVPELTGEIERAHDAGWQIAVHVTGDAGLDVVLDSFAPLGQDEIASGRHRLEHVSTIRDDQVERIAELGLIASVQHSWFHSGAMESLVRWLGHDRVSFSGRWRDLIDAGVRLTGSTDRPWAIVGESGDSMDALAFAVTRRGPGAAPPPEWMDAQKLTVWETLRSLTVDAAFAQGTEAMVGTIDPGKAADLVVLSADPTRTPPRHLRDIEVLATIVDGNIEYCNRGAPSDLKKLCPDNP